MKRQFEVPAGTAISTLTVGMAPGGRIRPMADVGHGPEQRIASRLTTVDPSRAEEAR